MPHSSMAQLRTLGTTARAMIVSENMLPGFAEVLLKLRRATSVRERHHQKEESSLETKKT